MSGVYKISNSNVINSKLQEYLPIGRHSNFRLVGKKKNIHFVQGKGTRLYDVDDNEYLDFNCKSGANILGHMNKEYIDKLANAMYEINAVDLSLQDYETCKIISENVAGAEQVRFSLSGTEAIENAIRLARAFTGKQWILRFIGNYHGNADNIMGGKIKNLDDPFPEEERDAYFTLGRANNVLRDQTILLPWNDSTILEKTIHKYGSNIAAILTEPISVNGGGILPQEGYLQHMRELCTRNNIVLIFDEIITGFRVDTGGAQKMYNVMPDLSVFGKAIAGGVLPVSAIVGKKRVMDLYAGNQVIHGGTFNGYRVGLKAVHTTLDILTRDNEAAFEKMKKQCKIMRNTIEKVAEEYDIKLQLRGYDTCFVSQYVNPENSQTLNMYANSLLEKLFIENGIYLCNGNRWYGNISLNSDDLLLLEKMLRRVFDEFVERLV